LPPRVPKPGEHLWSMRWRNANWHCELLFRGESYGWEAQIFRETDFTIGRRFILREEAAGWAEWMKAEIENERFGDELGKGGL
jgi:hypothetical protein